MKASNIFLFAGILFCLFSKQSLFSQQNLEVPGNLVVGELTQPGDSGAFGKKLYFGTPGDNYDNIYMTRFNRVTDVSDFLINIGDDSNDTFKIGYKDWQTGFFHSTFFMKMTGEVGIGTINPTHKLDVNGTIRAKEIKVESGWADFVFDKEYKLPSLTEVEKHIQENGCTGHRYSLLYG